MLNLRMDSVDTLCKELKEMMGLGLSESAHHLL
jgi:hypothetical protein